MTKTAEYFRVLQPLINHDEKDWEILTSKADQLASWGPELVQVFYDTLYGLEETRAVFHEGERPKVEKTLSDWWTDLIYNKKRDTIWEHQWIIGLLHVQRGVKNLYLLGMMNRLQQVFMEKCFTTFDLDTAIELYGAFLRITGCISIMIAESYVDGLLEGLSKVGMNEKLVERVRQMEVKKILAALRPESQITR